MHARTNRTTRAALGLATAVGALIITASPGHAAPTKISYDTAGETHISGLEAKLPLGPGQSDVEVDLQTGKLGAKITLPESRTDFALFGLPTHAKVRITQESDLAGTFQAGSVTVAGDFAIQITEVGHFGAGIPMQNCRTTEPVRIELKSEGSFSPTEGGRLTGQYQIPKFADCGFDTEIINGLVTGKDNPIAVDLKAKK
ncbi:hypothetical protein [Saccharopolyspora taberi]|uniref:Polyisoprenoid-binding protein YceI n=1 Tax=Saccharopolyspora taberi TaxID=60895 RepID=A0ABN3VAU0_9PSEU